MHVKYLILGAGPAGLTMAHALIECGVPRNQILVLEKESVAGGLCRSEQVDGAALDIGGGHFLDARTKATSGEFLFRFLPEQEWETFDRISTIMLRGREINHPIEANLWQLSTADQVDFLDSIAHAAVMRGAPPPSPFAEWVVWKFGDRIAHEYMLPYNRKIWSMDLNLLSTEWLDKLPNVSFREVIQSCVEQRSLGSLPCHAKFLYPKKYGYGEVWRRMGEALGESLQLNTPVETIDLASRLVNSEWQAEHIVSTLPWPIWPQVSQLPRNVETAMRSLRAVTLDVDYVAEPSPSKAYWVYYPDETLPYHRILTRENFLKGSRGYWTETNAARSRPACGWRHRNEYAYPISTTNRKAAIDTVHTWARENRILPVGRWGEWLQLNSDVVVTKARQAALELLKSVA